VPDDDGPAFLPEDRPAGPQGGRRPDVIFTSPLLRSVQTAEILAERLKHKARSS